MQSISIGRFDADPEAQGVIKPEDGSWQLVIDKEGYPHLFIRCQLEVESEGDPSEGLLNIDDMLPPGVTVPDLMKSKFGGKLPPEEEEKAAEEWAARKAANGIPCPR
jgi:hypothetical protein